MVGAATAKLREPKHVRSRGIDSKLVGRTQTTRRNVMFQQGVQVSRFIGGYSFVSNAGDLKLDSPLDLQPV